MHLWNWDGDTTHVGTAFTAMDATTISWSFSDAADYARNHPLAQVYVVKIGHSGIPISKWMAGGPTPDMYAAVKANVEAALLVVGGAKIAKIGWWQGEADAVAGATTYVSDFNSVVARLRGETWFDYTTPIIIMGTSVPGGAPYSTFNITLAQCAAEEPDVRKCVFTSQLPASLWDTGTHVHLIAEGYYQAGLLSSKASRAVQQKFFIDPFTGQYTLTGGNLVKGFTAALAINATGTVAGFQIHGIDAGSSSFAIFSNQATAGSGTLALVKSRGAVAGANTIVQNADSLGQITWRGYDGANPIPAVTISASVDGTPGANDMPGRLAFSTTADGAASATERLRIDSTGALIHRNNAQVVVDANSHLNFRSYTVATVPSASVAGQAIYVSNGTSNKRMAISDGTNWRWPDGAIVS
nr:sialate O-acetylesterase [Mesorhizobium sp. B2-4-19]